MWLISASETISLHWQDKRALLLVIQLPHPMLKALYPVEISPTGADNIELSQWVEHQEGAMLKAVMATVYRVSITILSPGGDRSQAGDTDAVSSAFTAGLTRAAHSPGGGMSSLQHHTGLLPHTQNSHQLPVL